MPRLSCGIVGLPNVGKSTLFNALTRGGAEVAPYPFCTIEPNVGVVPVSDPRLDRVARLADVGRIVYHTVEYVDVAGLVRGASKGEGRGNQFLENVRACDALVHVVRCFEDDNVAHVHGTIDPVGDIGTVMLELVLADLDTITRAREHLAKQARRDAAAAKVLQTLEQVHAHLDAEQCARTAPLSDEQRVHLREYRLLTAKPVLYAANIAEADLPGEASARVADVTALAAAEGNQVVPVCARFEEDVAGLAPDEAALFLADAGLEEPGLQRLARATSALLGLVSFFTFNAEEAHAWTVRRGTTAQQAAGVIHTDFADAFIRAEVTAFTDYDEAGGDKGAREHGRMRIEGRDYVVQDGDVIYFRVGP